VITFEGQTFASELDVRRYCQEKAQLANDDSREQRYYAELSLVSWAHDDEHEDWDRYAD
jgi:hypothetical protein